LIFCLPFSMDGLAEKGATMINLVSERAAQ
jgi:hypothetical protein